MTIQQQKKTWLIAGGAILAILLFVVWFARSPVATLDAIKDAAHREDVTELNELVDFTSLRTSIKLIISTDAGEGIDKPTPGSRLAHIIVGVFTAPIVDALVTPQSLIFLLNGQMPGERPPIVEESPAQISTDWQGLSVVELKAQPHENKEGGLTLVMRRNGLTWKLVGVRRSN